MARGQREVREVRGLGGGRQRSAPIVTYALIAINVAVFAITVAMAGSVAYNDTSKLFKDSSLLPLAVADGEVWRIVTSGFLHFGPIHLLVNMLALWIVGRDVEIILGRSRYLAVYFASILGGSAAVMMFQNVLSQTAGASGAIFGLFGAQAVILLRIRQSPGPVLTVIALNVFISITLPGISLMGHLGGLAAGVLSTAGILFGPQWLGIGTKPGATPRA
ncbi:rhomboid family intramembrane serine protease, partial [Smaragdicoccus niigatensis]|uniref:rhomboid family intramembrane serine protease n=1 Tax=Smaragdicoccus niigatensis TaxID=359359 RepID=UPI0007678305